MPSAALTRDAVRRLDRAAIDEFGVPGVVLMENAGRNAAEILMACEPAGPVVICCGKGNNGGDGFVIARHLDNQGIAVRVLIFAATTALSGDAAVNFRIVERSGIPYREFSGEVAAGELDREFRDADWIVDALLGTGAAGVVRGPFSTAIARINVSRARVLAIDVPSGLDCDTGQPLGDCVRADVTVTFVAPKPGFGKARSNLGEVHVADIGAPRAVLEQFGVADGTCDT